MPYNFTDDDKVTGTFWKAEKIGDKIQGTYIGKHQKFNQLTGKEQWIYELQTEDGEFFNIGGKTGIDAQMAHIKLGQIIEFRFVAIKPSTKPGLSAAKIIQIMAKKDLVDTKWLQEQEQNTTSNTTLNVEEVAKEFGGTVLSEPFPTDKVATIEELAIKKYSLIDKSQVIATVQEKTGLAFVDINYDTIIAKLKEA